MMLLICFNKDFLIMNLLVPIYIILCLLFMKDLLHIILSLLLMIIIMLFYAFFSYLQDYEGTDNLLIAFIKDLFIKKM